MKLLCIRDAKSPAAKHFGLQRERSTQSDVLKVHYTDLKEYFWWR